jgi:hypothetical protein
VERDSGSKRQAKAAIVVFPPPLFSETRSCLSVRADPCEALERLAVCQFAYSNVRPSAGARLWITDAKDPPRRSGGSVVRLATRHREQRQKKENAAPYPQEGAALKGRRMAG